MKTAATLRDWLGQRAVEVEKGKLNRLDAISINRMAQTIIRSAALELRYTLVHGESTGKARKIPFLEG